MCKVLEDMCYEYESKGRVAGRAEGRAEGRSESCLENARRMLQRGKLTYEEIAEDSNLSLDKIKELAKAMAQ